jgi:hypothetical protein
MVVILCRERVVIALVYLSERLIDVWFGIVV